MKKGSEKKMTARANRTCVNSWSQKLGCNRPAGRYVGSFPQGMQKKEKQKITAKRQPYYGESGDSWAV